MSTQPPFPKPERPLDDRAERQARQSRQLAEMAELGMEVARAIQKRALLADSLATMEKLSKEFANMVDSVCQTIALHAKLTASAEASRAAPAPAKREQLAPASNPEVELARRERARKRVKQSVEQAINASGDRKRAETLLLDLDERLEDEDIAAILGRHADVDVVLKLCQEFGVAPDLKPRRTLV